MYYAAAAVHHPITPSKRMKGKSGVGLYGDFIQDVDYSVGKFIKALKDKGLYGNTIFIFTSDNGGDIPKKSDSPELNAFQKGFRYNGICRADKHTIFEGGLKVPFIISWPNQLNAGQSSKSLVSTVDIFSTIAEAVTGEIPEPEVAAPDSFSFYSVLKNPQQKAERPFLVNRDAKGSQAIRQGKWKYVDDYNPSKNSRKIKHNEKMLFDLEKDPSETTNLLKSHPEVASRMHKLLEKSRAVDSTRKLHYN